MFKTPKFRFLSPERRSRNDFALNRPETQGNTIPQTQQSTKIQHRREAMAPAKKDTLTQWYEEQTSPSDTEFQLFQKGVTKSAQSMRERAMACVTAPGLNMKQDDIINHIKNAIGQLSDIPE